MQTLTRAEAFAAVAAELDHQDVKWGKDKPQSLPGFLLILEGELAEAKLGWLKNLEGRHAALDEIVQVAATAIACIIRYGASGSAMSTDDTPWSTLQPGHNNEPEKDG